jgi:hypothetical protein
VNEKDMLFAALGGAAVVITVLIGFALGWVWALPTGLLLLGAVAVARFRANLRSEREPITTTPRQVPEPADSPPNEAAVGPVWLATATPDFRLAFSARVLWRPNSTVDPGVGSAIPHPQIDPDAGSAHRPAAPAPNGSTSAAMVTADEAPRLPATDDSEQALWSGQGRKQRRNNGAGQWHADLAGLATAAAVDHVAEVVGNRPAAEATETQHRIAGDLVLPRPDPTGAVLWCAQDVVLQLVDSDAERLSRMSQLRKEVQVWNQERDHERNLRGYLVDDALKSPGTALVWWLAQHTDDVKGAVALIDDLARLSDASQNNGTPQRAVPVLAAAAPTLLDAAAEPGQRDLTATRDLLLSLFPDSEDERMLFALDLVSIADRSGRHSYARRVRTIFGLPDLDSEVSEPDDEEAER